MICSVSMRLLATSFLPPAPAQAWHPGGHPGAHSWPPFCALCGVWNPLVLLQLPLRLSAPRHLNPFSMGHQGQQQQC